MSRDTSPRIRHRKGSSLRRRCDYAWAAVWTPENRWLGLDPTNDQLVDERYITVGWGRDYADIPPLRGIIFTNSGAVSSTCRWMWPRWTGGVPVA